MNRWKHVIFILFFCVVLFAQDSIINVSINQVKDIYTVKCYSAEEYEQVHLQAKINALFVEVLNQESKGLHPYSQLHQIKELTKGLKE